MEVSTKKVIKNIGWLIFDQVFILLLQFFVGVKIANFYGGELYGKYSYALSIVAFSGIFFELLNGRVIKKYYTNENFNKIVYNVTFFKNTIAILLFSIPIIYKVFYKIDNSLFYLLLFICLDNILTTSTFGIENFFEFKLESRRIVVSNNIVKVISYILQYIGMILNLGIIYIPGIRCIGSLIRALILKYQYRKAYLEKRKKKKEKIDYTLLINIILEGKMLWISFVSFLIYTQMDKIMIEHYLGVEKVGVYSIGIQLSGILGILIGPIQNSVFPKLIELYKENYQKYYNFYLYTNTVITQGYIIISLISIIVVKYFFKYVYSEEYTEAIYIYIILVFSIIIKANAIFQMNHFVIKEITNKVLMKTLSGLIINTILNIILIPKIGIKGAAIATVITHFITAICMDYFIKEYRENFYIQVKSFNFLSTIKYLKIILKNKK